MNCFTQVITVLIKYYTPIPSSHKWSPSNWNSRQPTSSMALSVRSVSSCRLCSLLSSLTPALWVATSFSRLPTFISRLVMVRSDFWVSSSTYIHACSKRMSKWFKFAEYHVHACSWNSVWEKNSPRPSYRYLCIANIYYHGDDAIMVIYMYIIIKYRRKNSQIKISHQ